MREEKLVGFFKQRLNVSSEVNVHKKKTVGVEEKGDDNDVVEGKSGNSGG